MKGLLALLNLKRTVFIASGLSLAHALASPTSIETKQALDAQQSEQRLHQAIDHPEFLLQGEIHLPTSSTTPSKNALKLSLREAILLALRYNPNIQNVELDRVVQRYQLRLAHNEFEVQYALAGSATIEKNRYSGIGQDTTTSAMASPEFSYQSPLGTKAALNLDNNVNTYDSYSPVLNLSITQPLLRGFGREINQARLLNAEDQEVLNKLRLKQSIIDEITQVISAYRNLILSGHNLQNQRMQLVEAQNSYEINKKKIDAGQLEPTANIQQSYQIESLNLMVLQAENDFRVASLTLLQTIGLDPAMSLSVPNDLAVDFKPLPSESEAIKIALAQNNEYRNYLMVLRADERAVAVAKNQQLWQLDVGANVQTGMINSVDNNTQGLPSIYNGRNVNESATISLTIPIRDLPRRYEVINAKIKLEKDRINLLSAKRALITQIKNTLNAIKNLEQRYKLAERQVELAMSSYNLEKKKQAAGIATSLDVNNTQNQLLQAQMGLMGAKIAYLNQRSSLERLLGTTLDVWQIKLRFKG